MRNAISMLGKHDGNDGNVKAANSAYGGVINGFLISVKWEIFQGNVANLIPVNGLTLPNPVI